MSEQTPIHRRIIYDPETYIQELETKLSAAPQQDALDAKVQFEKWWETAVTKPPYSNPKEIARSAWLAAIQKGKQP